METKDHGLIDNWLGHIRDVYRYHRQEFDGLDDPEKRFDRLCELNVVEQVAHVCATTFVRNAWKAGSRLSVHGWIYSIKDGILKDLNVTVTGLEQVSSD